MCHQIGGVISPQEYFNVLRLNDYHKVSLKDMYPRIGWVLPSSKAGTTVHVYYHSFANINVHEEKNYYFCNLMRKYLEFAIITKLHKSKKKSVHSVTFISFSLNKYTDWLNWNNYRSLIMLNIIYILVLWTESKYCDC